MQIEVTAHFDKKDITILNISVDGTPYKITSSEEIPGDHLRRKFILKSPDNHVFNVTFYQETCQWELNNK